MKYEHRFRFGVPSSVIYGVLTSQEEMSRVTRGKATIESTEEGKISLYDGNILGTFKTLRRDKEIGMFWKIKSWEKFSDVKITFEDDEGESVVEIVHENFPEKEIPVVENTWLEAIFRPITIVLGLPIREGITSN